MLARRPPWPGHSVRRYYQHGTSALQFFQINVHLALRPFQWLLLAPRCSAAPLLLCALACCAVLPSLLLAAPHSLGWSKSNPQLWKDATHDVFESRGNLSVSDWTNERCFVGIRESFVSSCRAPVGANRLKARARRRRTRSGRSSSCSAERSHQPGPQCA